MRYGRTRRIDPVRRNRFHWSAIRPGRLSQNRRSKIVTCPSCGFVLAVPADHSSPSSGFVAVASDMGLLSQERALACSALRGLAKGTAVSDSSICQRNGWLTHRQVESVRAQIRRRGMTSRFGGYNLIDDLGSGSTGKVYLAEETSSGSYVALKILSIDPSDSWKALQRLRRESHLTAEVAHPALVRVLSTGFAEGKHYVVMEYVNGVTLASLLQAGPLDEAEALRIAREVADALAALHSHNVVHRDIKPANIMRTFEGRVKLMDLGLAKCTGMDSAGMTTDCILGTPLYMPPEQFDSARTVDGRADIYALGATLFHTLAGQPPVYGTSLIEIFRCHQRPMPRPSEINSSISPDVDALCLRMLAADPEDRFQSAASVRSAIDACLTKQCRCSA